VVEARSSTAILPNSLGFENVVKDVMKAKKKSAPTNAEAQSVAEWAYRNLRQNKSEPFPYTFEFQFEPTRMAKLVTQQESEKPFDASEIRQQVEVLSNLASNAAARYTVARVETFAPSTNPANADELVACLDDVVKQANKLVFQFAIAGSRKAVERLAARSLGSAIALLKLTRSNLDLVKPVARQWCMWPVAYNPHWNSKKEMEEMIKKLEVGRVAPENMQGKWSNVNTEGQPFKKVLGTYAARIMQHVLRPLHDIPTMRQRLVAEARMDISFLGNPPPLTGEEKERLIAQGWPRWIVDLVNLPPFSNEAAKDWFEVGWAALKEMTGGNVTSIKELRPIGESRAKEWRAQGASVAQQENQRECGIHDQLRKSFLHRFRLAE
jgi:hypothetical protein